MGSNLRILSYFVIFYMIFALIWWSILLYRKNKDVFLSQYELIEYKYSDNEKYQRSKQIEKNFRSQNLMIFGETFFFVISITIGIWLINRSHKKEMIAANQSKNFLLSITHELKSPLASIQLILETFEKRNLPHEKIKQLCSGGLKETSRLNTLVDDLLISAQLDSSYQLFPEEFEICPFLEEQIKSFKSLQPESIIETLHSHSQKKITADKNAISIILRNLLENSIKYSSSPAKILVKTIFNNTEFILEIIDNGWGIPDEEKQKIFQPFYRIGNEETRKTKGTGLGLYMVKKLIEMHKGQISTNDNPAGGNIMKISLPIK
ncbi:MAG: hypothetical protein RJA52_602 [Bacteroidota bacterium]|jgi:signal transduction histidine kinase